MTTIVAFAIMTINLSNVTTDVNMTLMAIAIIRIVIAKSAINILSIIIFIYPSQHDRQSCNRLPQHQNIGTIIASGHHWHKYRPIIMTTKTMITMQMNTLIVSIKIVVIVVLASCFPL